MDLTFKFPKIITRAMFVLYRMKKLFLALFSIQKIVGILELVVNFHPTVGYYKKER
jgi:hypothetical protein